MDMALLCLPLLCLGDTGDLSGRVCWMYGVTRRWISARKQVEREDPYDEHSCVR